MEKDQTETKNFSSEKKNEGIKVDHATCARDVSCNIHMAVILN